MLLLLQNIINQLAGQVGPQLKSDFNLSDRQIADVLKVVGDSSKTTLTNQLTSADGLGAMMSLFSNKPNSSSANALQNTLINNIINGLIQKLGFDKKLATNISNTVVPMLTQMITKQNSKTPVTDASPLLEMLGADPKSLLGNAGGLLGKLGGLGGLFKK